MQGFNRRDSSMNRVQYDIFGGQGPFSFISFKPHNMKNDAKTCSSKREKSNTTLLFRNVNLCKNPNITTYAVLFM
jgi:hypothetical protein